MILGAKVRIIIGTAKYLAVPISIHLIHEVTHVASAVKLLIIIATLQSHFFIWQTNCICQFFRIFAPSSNTFTMKRTILATVLCAFFAVSSQAQEKLFQSANVQSPVVNADGTVTFNIFAPKAVKVEVTGDFLPPTTIDVPGFGTVEQPGVAQLKEG